MAGTLYVVATPIGNLADASPRALETLRAVQLIACEDTRVTRTLLARHGIATPTTALHEHNERAATGKLISFLLENKSIALVSDAGTPGLSDPGALLVEAAHRAGIRESPIPGPSAAAAALAASGFAGGRFLFAGFLPASGAERRRQLDALEAPLPVVLYEAPHRVQRTLADLRARLGDGREVVVARELSKKFEQVARLPLGEAGAWLEADPARLQGEFVLVLAPGAGKADAAAVDPEHVLELLLGELSPSDAARLAAKICGVPKNALYRKALARGK